MNTTSDVASSLRERVRFGVSAVLETCYAMTQVSGVHQRVEVHGQWCRKARQRLGPVFAERLRVLGGWPMIWPIVADTLPRDVLLGPVDEAIGRALSQPVERFAAEFLGGVLHEPRLARGVLRGELSPKDAVTGSPRAKRDWLVFAGLYPFDERSPAAKTLQRVAAAPAQFRDEVFSLLREFWGVVFEAAWHVLLPQLERSADEKSRLWAATTPQRFADELRLRIEIDARKRQIRAVRGGYALPLADLHEAWMLPSTFNVHHFWHTLGHGNQLTAFFPYFEPAIAVGIAATQARVSSAAADIDPALVFKALGDPTRYATMLLLGRSPRTATDLASELSLSKGTISHHIHVLREAGLISETAVGKSVLLDLNRLTVEQLSNSTLQVIQDQEHSTWPRRRARSAPD